MAGARNPNVDDFDSDDERLNCASNMKEGLDPRGVFEDWGDSVVDYPEESRTDVHYSSTDEVEEYWDSLRSSGVKLREDD